jgi:RluA family pseudouridine synthase
LVVLPGDPRGLDLGVIFDRPAPAPEGWDERPRARGGRVPRFLAGSPAWSLAARLEGCSEAEARGLVEFGCLWLDRRVQLDPAAPLPEAPFVLTVPPYEPRVFYEADPARIVFQDEDILVYDKEAGVPSQPVPSDARNNLWGALERGTGLFLRPVHRLDAPTSGLIVFAVNRLAASRLGRLFQERRIKKRYLAFSPGPAPEWGERLVDAAISKSGSQYFAREGGPGAPSQTRLRVHEVRDADGGAVYLAEPLTGRTHQIRLHMALVGLPIMGDRRYGGAEAGRLYLRAAGLTFRHPCTGRLLSFGGPEDPGDEDGEGGV